MLRNVMLIFIALVTMAASVAEASEEQYVPWKQVSFVATAPAPYGEVAVEITREAKNSLIKTLNITLQGGKTLTLPTGALSGINAPQLKSAQTSFEVGYDPTPWFYVTLSYGSPVTTKGGVLWPKVTFAIQGDRIVYRSLRTPKPDGQYDWKQEKFQE